MAKQRPKTEKTEKIERAMPEVPQSRGRIAFAAMLPTYRAMATTDVFSANTDVSAAVGRALAVRETALAMRPHIVEELPKFDLANIDQLETLALAAWHCWMLRGAGADKGAKLKPLIELGTPLRGKLARAAASLRDAPDLIDADTIEAIDTIAEQQGTRTEDLAHDLVAYYDLFTSSWEKVRNNTVVTLQDLASAQSTGLLLLEAIAARSVEVPVTQDPEHPATWVDAAFTGFANAYDQIRRAATYLRWSNGDVDKLFPSLWAQAGAGRPARSDAEPAPPEPTPPEPVPTPVG